MRPSCPPLWDSSGKDPPDAAPSVPGILGMNVIQRCYREHIGVHGPSLFELPAVAQASGPVIEALQKCHQASDQPLKTLTGTVRVRGTQTVRIPGGVMKLVASTCPEHVSGDTMLFEPPESGVWLAGWAACIPMSCPGHSRYSLYSSGQCRDH